MTEDARFEDGGEKPLNLGAFDADDLGILSALVQDGVLTVGDMSWDPRARRLSLLINRLRREDEPAAQRARRPVERVRTLMVFDNVTGVSSQGIDRNDRQTVLSILSVEFEEADSPEGNIILTLAGDGALRARVEAIEVRLKDVTKPYVAPSGRAPDHGT